MYRESGTTKSTTEDGGVSAKYSLAANAKSELHKALYDKTYRNEVLLRDETPAIMLSQKGVINRQMVMNASHIRENVFTEDEARNLGLKVDEHTHYHGIGENYFLKIIDSLDNVKEAYRGTKNASDSSRRENYFLLVTEFKDESGNIINVPVFIDELAQCNRVFIQTNKIATVFGREGFRNYINRQVNERNLVRIKNKSKTTSEGDALVAPAYESFALNDSISNPEENVNTEKSNDNSNDIVPVQNSLSNNGEQVTKKHGDYAVSGEDIRLETQDDIAPLPKNAENNTEYPDDYAPMGEGVVEDDAETKESDAEIDNIIKTLKDGLAQKRQNIVIFRFQRSDIFCFAKCDIETYGFSDIIFAS